MTGSSDPGAGRPQDDGLKHNPFAALRARVPPSGDSPAPSDRAAPVPDPAPVRVPERVTVRRERSGRGGKSVTLAEGPGLAGTDLVALARDAARALGLGARVEGRALVLQGDQAERLVAWLEARGFGRVERGN